VFYLAQVTSLSTGNPKLDAIAQASALGIALAGILVKSFKKSPARKETTAKVRASKTTAPKVVITDEAIDEAGARR
jgi:hypothetical protein